MVKSVDEIFRDFETDGVPSSGVHKPIKADIRELLNSMDVLPSPVADTMLVQPSDLSGYQAKTASQVRDFLEVMKITSAVQGRLLKFSKYRSIYSTDEAAFQAMLVDAFSTTAIDNRGAFLDGEGATITIGPQDIATITGRTTNYKNITISNFTFFADDTNTAWAPTEYSRSCGMTQFSNTLTVSSTTNLSPGMFVGKTGRQQPGDSDGMCRETYVQEVIDATTVRIQTSPYRTRSGVFYLFTDYKYFLDFKGFSICSRVHIVHCNFRCQGVANPVRMSEDGIDWFFFDTHALNVAARLFTDWGRATSGAVFLANTAWSDDNSETRQTIGLTAGSGDCKIYFNRWINFRHSFVGHGGGYTIVGNHNWQGGVTEFTRQAAFVHTQPRPYTVYTGNYIDNGGIEISTENTDSASSPINDITITGNIMTFSEGATNDSRYIILNLPGWDGDTGTHPIDGLTICNNVFRRLLGSGGGVTAIPTVEEVRLPSSVGGLDKTQVRNFAFTGNVFRNITYQKSNPSSYAITNTSTATNWDFNFANRIPFGLVPNSIIATQLGGMAGMKDGSDVISPTSYTTYQTGVASNVRCTLAAARKGTICVTADANLNT